MSDTLHVLPIGDLIDHDTSTPEPDCVCGPRTELVKHSNGTDAGWILVHNALDGREKEETP